MIRVAVIGVGSMGKNHARIYSDMEKVELVGVVDKDKKTGNDAAKRFGVPYYEDYSEIMGYVDAVSIVVPTKYHYEVAIDFIKAKIDVLVEKPITTSLEEADKLIEFADMNNRILQVGHVERFNPALMQARKHITPGTLILDAHRIGSTTRIQDSGVILDLMIHDIDIALAIIDDEVESHFAYGTSESKNHEDFVSAMLKFKKGSAAILTASRMTQKRERLLQITQKDSYMVVDYMNKVLDVYKQAKAEYTVDGKEMRFAYSDVMERSQIPQIEPLKLELESFINCVRTRKPPQVDGKAGRNALKVALDLLGDIQ